MGQDELVRWNVSEGQDELGDEEGPAEAVEGDGAR